MVDIAIYCRFNYNNQKK